MKYTAPTGEFCSGFDYVGFFKGQIEGYFHDVIAGFKQFVGNIQAFATNVLNGNAKVDKGVAIIHKGVEIKSCYSPSCNSNNDINDVSETLQCLLGSPVTISEKGVSATVSFNLNESLSLGGTLSVRKPDLSKDLIRTGGTLFLDFGNFVGISANIGLSAPVNNIDNNLKIEAIEEHNIASDKKNPMRYF